jgi:hypothetical protein
MEKLDTLPINVPILSRRKVMMKEPSKIRRKETLIIKISSTRKMKCSLPKKTIAHQKKMNKTNHSFYLWE